MLAARFTAALDIHNSTTDRMTVVRLLRSLRDRFNLHYYSNCWSSNTRC